MGRLSGENQGVVRARAAGANRVHIVIEGVEGGVRQPCFVKMQGVYGRVENVFDLFDVVHNPIVGTLGNGQDTWLFVFSMTGKGVVFDLFPYCRWIKLTLWNGANNAVVIARRH